MLLLIGNLSDKESKTEVNKLAAKKSVSDLEVNVLEKKLVK